MARWVKFSWWSCWSEHGTNPASAQMVGLKVVPIECNLEGNISIKDLKEKTELYNDGSISSCIY